MIFLTHNYKLSAGKNAFYVRVNGSFCLRTIWELLDLIFTKTQKVDLNTTGICFSARIFLHFCLRTIWGLLDLTFLKMRKNDLNTGGEIAHVQKDQKVPANLLGAADFFCQKNAKKS